MDYEESSQNNRRIFDMIVDTSRRELSRNLALLNSLPILNDEKKVEALKLLDEIEKLDNQLEIDPEALETVERALVNKEEETTMEEVERIYRDALGEVTEDTRGELWRTIAETREHLSRRPGAASTSRAAGGETDEDEDLVVKEAVLDLKDPLTKQDIQDPVRNRFCGHVYERSSAREYIRQNKQQRMACYQCPVAMCQNKRNLDMKDLEPFPQFFEKAREQQERLKQRRDRLAMGGDDDSDDIF